MRPEDHPPYFLGGGGAEGAWWLELSFYKVQVLILHALPPEMEAADLNGSALPADSLKSNEGDRMGRTAGPPYCILLQKKSPVGIINYFDWTIVHNFSTGHFFYNNKLINQ